MKEIVDENTEWEEERDDLGHVICYTKVTTTEEITDNVPSKRVTKIPYRISPTDGIREITSIRYEDRTTGENAKIGPHHETWTSLEKYHKDRKIVPQGKELCPLCGTAISDWRGKIKRHCKESHYKPQNTQKFW